MSSESRYFIKTGYQPNAAVQTMDGVSGGQYWSTSRIRAAAYYQLPVYSYANRLIDELGATTLVDVGCGPGIKLRSIHEQHPDLDIVGIDQASAIDYCQTHHTFGRWYIDDFEHPSTNLPDIRGDLVICSDVVEHLANPDKLLLYLSARVADGGVIVLSTPERDRLHGPGCNECPNKAHVREWTAEEMEAYLVSRGFEILHHSFQFPVRSGFNRLFFRYVLWRSLRGMNPKYNQVFLLRQVGRANTSTE